MKHPRIEIYEARDGFRWRLRAANSRVLCQGESHTRKRDVLRAIYTVQAYFEQLQEVFVLKEIEP
jgi:uncharacterized protein YegP (UPF0339 family)